MALPATWEGTFSDQPKLQKYEALTTAAAATVVRLAVLPDENAPGIMTKYAVFEPPFSPDFAEELAELTGTRVGQTVEGVFTTLILDPQVIFRHEAAGDLVKTFAETLEVMGGHELQSHPDVAEPGYYMTRAAYEHMISRRRWDP